MHDSTHCDKCSESDYNYLELDPTWVSLEHPEEERGRNRGRPGWMYYTCLLVTGFSARRPQHSCKRAEQRDREQLQSSCQPHQSATNGTAYSVGTGTHTTHTHSEPRLAPRNSALSISLLSLKIPAPIFWVTFLLQLQQYTKEFPGLLKLEEIVQLQGFPRIFKTFLINSRTHGG